MKRIDGIYEGYIEMVPVVRRKFYGSGAFMYYYTVEFVEVER